MTSQKNHAIKIAQKYSLLSIVVYIGLALLKLITGYFFKSTAIVADGYNNFTDVLSSIIIFIGLIIAQKPADHSHQYGHWKAENIASLFSAFFMLYIGIQVLIDAIIRIFSGTYQRQSIESLGIIFVSSIVIFSLFIINRHIAHKIQSKGLKATAQNNLSDAMTTLLTGISIICSFYFQWYWMDNIIALLIAAIILKTGISILNDNIFSLSDGFNNDQLALYRQTILSHPEIKGIRLLKAREYGSNTYVDVTVLMEQSLTIYESHLVTEEIEHELYEKYDVIFTDVHVEPFITSKNAEH